LLLVVVSILGLVGWAVELKEKMAELSNTQIEALLQSYLRQVLEQDERERSLERKSWKGEEDPDEHVGAMAYLQHDCRRELAIGNYSRGTGAVDLLLKERGIELDRDGVSYKKLCRGMMKLMINHLEIDIRRTRLDYSLDNLPFTELL
jgi:hypothetical protein